MEPFQRKVYLVAHPVGTLAALARGNAGDIRAIPELLDALSHNDEEISDEAIIALGNIGDATIASHLIDTLYHRWDRSRYLIADALEKMGSAVVPILQNILNEENVTLGIKWPGRPGYHVPAVFQIAFSRSNLASGSMSSQQLNAESTLEADKIRSSNLYFRPFYGLFLHFRPHYAVLTRQLVSLNASAYRPGYTVFGGH